MRKLVITVVGILAVCIFFSAFAATNENDISDNGLNPVKSEAVISDYSSL